MFTVLVLQRENGYNDLEADVAQCGAVSGCVQGRDSRQEPLGLGESSRRPLARS